MSEYSNGIDWHININDKDGSREDDPLLYEQVRFDPETEAELARIDLEWELEGERLKRIIRGIDEHQTG